MIRCYSDLRQLRTIEERFQYLKVAGMVGEQTFGFDRYLNQQFYRDRRWAEARNEVIIRDNGCDLGIEGYSIAEGLVVHHMNPITVDDILQKKEDLFNPEYLICVSERTHKAIHYGDATLLPKSPTKREPGDTCPWR